MCISRLVSTSSFVEMSRLVGTSRFENDIVNFGTVKQTKDTDINNCHNEMWNNSNVFSSSVPGFSRSPKQSI